MGVPSDRNQPGGENPRPSLDVDLEMQANDLFHGDDIETWFADRATAILAPFSVTVSGFVGAIVHPILTLLASIFEAILWSLVYLAVGILRVLAGTIFTRRNFCRLLIVVSTLAIMFTTFLVVFSVIARATGTTDIILAVIRHYRTAH